MDAQQAAALFVGIRTFSNDRLVEVPFAIDDAVDLAYELAVDHHPILVPPNRVVLALSDGEPRKPESRRKLQELLAAGASRRPAGYAEILEALERQSKRVGREGILIVSFATHGVAYQHAQHLLTATSRLEPLAATVTDHDISDILWRNGVPRSLVLIDACRERLTSDGRTGRADPRAAFIRLMTGVEGQVVISGAPAGGFAYDDQARQNGVFTASVIDGLRCGAAKDRHHFITVGTLYSFVSDEVLRWVREHKNPHLRKATQLICEGQTIRMPLSICINRTASASEPRPR